MLQEKIGKNLSKIIVIHVFNGLLFDLDGRKLQNVQIYGLYIQVSEINKYANSSRIIPIYVQE